MLSQTRKPILERGWFIPLALIVLAAVGFSFRCLHLFEQNHYYILSPDSYFFHWAAQGVMAGDPPSSVPGAQDAYTLHSGLTYPLAYIGRAVSYVFGMPSADALELVSKMLPPFLGILSMVLIYLAAARMFDRKVGLFAAFTWTFISPAMLTGAAGFLDRDPLSILLVMMGAFLFYLSGGFHFRVGGRDIGWVVAGLGVLAVEALLYLEWTFVGAAFLFVIIILYFVVKLLLEYFRRMETEPNTMRRVSAALRQTNWRVFALVIVLNLAVIGLWAAVNPQGISSGVDVIKDIVLVKTTEGGQEIAELRGLSILEFLNFQFFLIPMIFGIYVFWKKRSEGALFVMCWFLGLLALSLLTKRIFLYTIPAACVLSGIGFGFIWNWQFWKAIGEDIYAALSTLGVSSLGVWGFWGWLQQHASKALPVALVFFAVAYSFFSASGLAVSYGMSADREWQGAMAYLREETSREAMIMSQWSWGYWILDLGQRRPLVDNGYYGYNSERLKDVALVYFTSDPTEAVQLMDKWGADLLVFSTLDRDVAKTIMGWAGVGEGLDSFPADSLIEQSLTGKFGSGGGLEVVYQSGLESETSPDYEVVILKLSDG